MGVISTINRMLKRTNSFSIIKEQNGLFGSLSNRLYSLFDEIEEEFLSVGSKLQDFSMCSKELSGMTSSAAKLTSGDDINTAIKGLREQMSAMSQYFGSSRNESGSGIKKLLHILDVNEELTPICNGFNKISQTLNFLSVSAQVESAHFGEAGAEFNTFTNDINELAQTINIKTKDIQNNSKSLTLQIQNVLVRARELSKTQQSSSVDILKDAQSNLESLIDLNEKSFMVSTRLEERSTIIHQSIGEVVASMQFHDISRQHVEHVGKAMNEIHEKLDEAKKANDSVSRNQKMELARWVSDSCELELSQLFYIKDEFVDAVNKMIESLKKIAVNVTAVFDELQKVDRTTQETNTSFLSKIEEGIATIIESLNEDSRIGSEISNSVSMTVDSMSVFVNDIEEIGSKIKMIALNAQVKAANAGEHGKTLGVIAGAIQQLSVDTREQTSALLDKLRTITDDTRSFHSNTDSSLESGEDKVKSMVNVLEKQLGSIRNINAEFLSNLDSIDEIGHILGKEIEVAVNDIRFHKNISDSIDSITVELDSMVQKLKKLTPYSNKSRELKTLKEHNPMLRELEVSQSSIPDATLALTSRNGNGLTDKTLERFTGDNVELF